MFKLEFTVRKARWIENPNLRWRAGLEQAGLQFRQRLQRSNYPPPPPFSRYVRTGLTADKAGFQIYEVGGSIQMWFGSTFYLPDLLFGADHWPGWTPYRKREEILEYMTLGFKQGVKDYTE